MIIVGLTGGIGSGKTAVTERFKRLGVPIIDADIITRELVTPGSLALKRIIERFGEKIIDQSGNLDRQRLRQLVFADSSARKDLERILHPEVGNEIIKRLKKIEAPYSLVVVPLMVEAGMVELFDRVIVVDCDETAQIKRVVQRDGCSEPQAKAILRSQANRKARLAIATDIIQNTDSIDKLDRQVEQLHDHLLELAENPI